ncbi:MAG: hypothetical protein F4Y99_10750 [Acidimicrobiaceae bacterium]|nr:hypothetical protein [Acidimicrobiaceae bacterium]MYF41748.1 hypothetical protein [Acidimicrobiaceae bacterium]MYJ36190.1 hypothetical protein [Acidimicrobiaceae bacterium]
MPTPASPSDSGVQDSVGTDPRMLMAQEFLVLAAFIAGLLDDLTDAPPDWQPPTDGSRRCSAWRQYESNWYAEWL